MVNISSLMQIYYSIGNITKESGPVSMTFTIPMYNVSRLQVNILRMMDALNLF